MNRRKVLKTAIAASALSIGVTGLPAVVRAATQAPKLPFTIDETALIYLTPLKSDGSESACQAEVWFVHDQEEVFVVTASDAWRARAITAGLNQARIWVGDVGVWNSDARYKVLPVVDVVGDQIIETDEQTRVLAHFGDKYSLEWLVWGSRFRNGLADGSRVMLRYQIG